MWARWAALCALISLAGCALAPTQVDAPAMPLQSGLADPVNAIQYSAWAFATPARTAGNPGEAARAVAALEYAAGQLNNNQTFFGVNPLVDQQMLSARLAVRQALGIRPDTPSQVIVNAMIAVSQAMAAGDTGLALRALSSPYFTLGPQRTLALLTNMPFIRMANIATAQANAAVNGPICILCGHGGFD